MIKSLPLAENLELDGACRCASQWLQRWNNMTFWPRLRRRHEDEVLVFNAQLAQVLGLDRKWLLGLLPTERGFQMFPSYFHHFWLSCNNMGFWQNTVFGCVWWSSRAFMSSNRSDTSWAPGPWRRGESQGTGGRANSTSGILNLWARCPFHMSGLVTCWMEWSPFPSYRVLISIGRHWHTLPAQVTNYSSQRNCSANVVAYCRILARMLKHVKTSQQKVWGAWNQTRSRCWHLQVATAWNSWKCHLAFEAL